MPKGFWTNTLDTAHKTKFDADDHYAYRRDGNIHGRYSRDAACAVILDAIGTSSDILKSGTAVLVAPGDKDDANAYAVAGMLRSANRSLHVDAKMAKMTASQFIDGFLGNSAVVYTLCTHTRSRGAVRRPALRHDLQRLARRQQMGRRHYSEVLEKVVSEMDGGGERWPDHRLRRRARLDQ
jgi:hypothetical protein